MCGRPVELWCTPGRARVVWYHVHVWCSRRVNWIAGASGHRRQQELRSTLSEASTRRRTPGCVNGTSTHAPALLRQRAVHYLVSPPQRSEGSAKSAEVWAEKVRAWLRCAWLGPDGVVGALCWARRKCMGREHAHVGCDCTRGGARACMYLE